jgi:hypothetical protein
MWFLKTMGIALTIVAMLMETSNAACGPTPAGTKLYVAGPDTAGQISCDWPICYTSGQGPALCRDLTTPFNCVMYYHHNPWFWFGDKCSQCFCVAGPISKSKECYDDKGKWLQRKSDLWQCLHGPELVLERKSIPRPGRARPS